MHSPGGIPGISSAVTWNHTSAERQYGAGLDLLTPLAVAGFTALSLTQAGALVRIGGWGLRVVTSPKVWAGYNLYKEQADIRHALKGGKFRPDVSMTYRPLRFPGWFGRPLAIAIPFPWLDWQGVHVEGSSSQGLVQNGGPSAPLQVSSTTSDILSLGKISRPTRSSSAKRVIRPKSRKGRRKRCPPGHRWNGRRCVPIRKR